MNPDEAAKRLLSERAEAGPGDTIPAPKRGAHAEYSPMSSKQTRAAGLERAGSARAGLSSEVRSAAAFRAAWPYWSVLLALLAGAALRCFFILVYPEYDGDTGVYGTIAKNILLNHAYALDKPFHLTLIRLPGYPLFFALIFKLFGLDCYGVVQGIQAAMTWLHAC